jgi:Xaa-Pro dipeptidase
VQKVFENHKADLEAILIKNSSEPYIDSNFFYTTGLKKGLFENSVAVLFSDGYIDLIVPSLEEVSAKKAVDSEIYVYSNKDEYIKNLKNSLKNNKKIGLNFNSITYKDFKNFEELFSNSEFFDAEESFSKTRRVKDEKEIFFIKKASEIVDRVVEKIPEIVTEGIHEFELASEMEYLMGRYGSDKPAFETISSFGSNTAEPHYTHGKKKISDGDFVLCDFGANYMKYNSDITRTFIFGNCSEKQKKIYETVKQAQQKGLELIKPGVKASEVHKVVFDFIQNSPFKDCFIHSTGHSLGLDVHDPGLSINSESDVVLEENMVFTVEPGVYIPGFGGVRIEDDIRVIGDGFEFLTESSKDIVNI